MTATALLLRVTELVAGHDRPVVGPLSFTLGPGEVLGLWGSNGSGKSTLLDAIADSARVFSGSVQRAPSLTLAYQEQRPVRLPAMPLTGGDLLRVAGIERPAAVGVAPSPPASLRALLGRRVDALSGGQYQLLCVWAALAGPADLVLLDEPTNNLDPDHEALLRDMLAGPRGRRAVLLVSHERGFLEAACSRVLGLG